jgi:hypothetical protein
MYLHNDGILSGLQQKLAISSASVPSSSSPKPTPPTDAKGVVEPEDGVTESGGAAATTNMTASMVDELKVGCCKYSWMSVVIINPNCSLSTKDRSH